MNKHVLFKITDLSDRTPAYSLVANVDLVVVLYDDQVSVLYGRCAHRGALMSDGHIDGDNIICGVHNWDYRLDTGVSEYNNSEVLHKFTAGIENSEIWVDADEVAEWELANPQSFDRDAYQGLYQDHTGTKDEPHVGLIQELAANGLSKLGHHGPMGAMGVSRNELPSWDDIQLNVAQLHKMPLLDGADVGTDIVIGKNAKNLFIYRYHLFVSDMSFGALSEEAKIALAAGAELAGTGICSGEGGMLAEEQEANSRYFYELASARFGFSWDKVQASQAFPF